MFLYPTFDFYLKKFKFKTMRPKILENNLTWHVTSLTLSLDICCFISFNKNLIKNKNLKKINIIHIYSLFQRKF